MITDNYYSIKEGQQVSYNCNGKRKPSMNMNAHTVVNTDTTKELMNGGGTVREIV